MLVVRLIVFCLGTVAALAWSRGFANPARPQRHFSSVFWDRLAMGTVSVYFVFYLLLKFTQHYSLNTNAFDLSVYDYSLFNLVQGKGLWVPFWQTSFLAEHFSPFLYVLAPVYALVPRPETLLVLQCLAVALAAWPLYALAVHQLQSRPMAFVLVFVYLNYWTVVQGLLYEFHVEMLVPLLVLSLLWAWVARRTYLYWLFLVLALMCKEDMGIYLFALGVFLAVHEKRVWQGGLTASLALVWTLLGLWIIGRVSHQPFLVGYKFFHNWNDWVHPGQGWPALLQNVWTLCVNVPTWRLIYPLAGLPLVSWWGLTCLVPLGVNASSSNPMQANFLLYYAAPVIPFLFAGTVFGLKNIIRKAPRFRVEIMLGVACFLLTFNLHNYHPDRVEPRHRAIRTVLNTIPTESRIASQGNLVPHLHHREGIHVLPQWTLSDQYLLLDLNGNPFPMTVRQRADLYQTLLQTPGYQKVSEEQGLVIFKKQ